MPAFIDPQKRALQVGADRTAVIFENRRTSYRELWQRCGKLAGMVSTKGAVPGDRIAILAENSSQYLEMYLQYSKPPKAITFSETELPKSEPGNILKRELRRPFWEGRQRGIN